MKTDVKMDVKLDMELDMKISHGRAKEEREACARGEDDVQAGQNPVDRPQTGQPVLGPVDRSPTGRQPEGTHRTGKNRKVARRRSATHQNDLSLDDYALKLKSLSDELRDLEFPIDDKIMLSTLSAGLGEDLSNAASNLTLLTTPTFEQAVAYLRLEERRLKHLRARAAHTAFAAGFSRGAQTR
ncbi:hypothetical protein QYE76_029955 [Lolium multiflorum]|uniref:Uncharacterized protein n=1 Tax=Lolium multiflorum TaxID=4521 RepID=A0AAD8QRG1_LOLMU|nr:hypothetical protein QYE76_029955 [Lolium multiflorum]